MTELKTSIPEPPDGYTDFRICKMPKWIIYGSAVLLLGIWAWIILTLDVILLPGLKAEIIGLAIGVPGTIFLHESIHYVTNLMFGYNPEYDWPSTVYFTHDILTVEETVVILLSPQLLTIAYILALSTGIPVALQPLLGWGLMMNIAGASGDIPWAIRRLTWPPGNIVAITEEKETLVAFPKNG